MITLAEYLEKRAYMTMYDHKNEARKRDYIPPRPDIHPDVVDNTNETKVEVSVPESSNKDLPANGENHNADPNMYPTWRYIHPFNNTPSGTGGGPQYWTERTNPYDS